MRSREKRKSDGVETHECSDRGQVREPSENGAGTLGKGHVREQDPDDGEPQSDDGESALGGLGKNLRRLPSKRESVDSST